jgi:hypothetical protein
MVTAMGMAVVLVMVAVLAMAAMAAALVTAEVSGGANWVMAEVGGLQYW